MEGTFKGETVHYVEFSKHHDPSCTFLAFFYPEATARERKDRILMAAE